MFTIKCRHAFTASEEIREGISVEIDSPFFKDGDFVSDAKNRFSCVPWINSHDHLIGNWYPRSGTNAPYVNSHIWVEDNKVSSSFMERSKIWVNTGEFNLVNGNAPLLVKLGVYKNIFSAVSIVQDHGAQQVPAYYDMFPIEVIRNYAQCHSITLGNWWGGLSAEEEMARSGGKIPFIIHLAEGTDEITRSEFSLLKNRGLLRKNTLIVHGIALTTAEIREVARAQASLCWCPASNIYLIGKTLDIDTALSEGVNVVIGTDSTMTGSQHMFDEIRFAHGTNPRVSTENLLKMVTVNARKAMMIQDPALLDPRKNVLILSDKKDNVYDNVLFQEFDDIHLMVQKGIPIYGDIAFMDFMKINVADYGFFKTGNREKFILGHPEEIMKTIDEILGYPKTLPYLPWT